MIAYAIELIDPKTTFGPRTLHVSPSDVHVAPAIRELYKKGERSFYVHCQIYHRSKLIENKTISIYIDDFISENKLKQLITRWTINDMRRSQEEKHHIKKDS